MPLSSVKAMFFPSYRYLLRLANAFIHASGVYFAPHGVFSLFYNALQPLCGLHRLIQLGLGDPTAGYHVLYDLLRIALERLTKLDKTGDNITPAAHP
jgi:hypothetical protein